MKRALFLVEARRSTVQVATLTAATLVVLMIVETVMVRGGGRAAGDVRTVVDMFALGAAVIAGLVLGIHAFGGDTRRRELEFLGALPVGRGQAFALVATARVAAGAVGFVILLILRPWVLSIQWPTAERLWGTPFTFTAALYLVLLAAGMCSGAIFRRAAIAYAVAVPVLAFAAVETIVGSLSELLPPLDVWTRVGVAVAGLFAITGWHVRRGELDLRRVRMRGLLVAVMFCAVYIALFQREPSGMSDPRAQVRLQSPAACRLAAVERIGRGRSRTSMFDTRTGARLGRFTLPILPQFQFAIDGSAVWLLGTPHWPLRMLDLAWPRELATYRWMRGDRLEGPIELPSGYLSEFVPLAEAGALALIRDEAGTRLLKLGGATITIRPLLLTPLGGMDWLYPVGDEWALTIMNVGSRASGRRWLISDVAREIDSRVELPEDLRPYGFVDGRYYPDQRVLEAEILARAPGDFDRLVLPRVLDATHGSIFGLEAEGNGKTVTLHVLDRAAGRWFALDRNVVEETAKLIPRFGLAIYVKETGSTDVIAVFDARMGRHEDLLTLPHGDDPTEAGHSAVRSIYMDATPDGAHWNATFAMTPQRTTDGHRRTLTVLGNRTAGTIQARWIASDGDLVMIDVEGNVVRLDSGHPGYVLTRTDGVEVPLRD